LAVVQENIVRLDIPVENTVLVQVVEGSSYPDSQEDDFSEPEGTTEGAVIDQ
jgi:hypothetical protein